MYTVRRRSKTSNHPIHKIKLIKNEAFYDNEGEIQKTGDSKILDAISYSITGDEILRLQLETNSEHRTFIIDDKTDLNDEIIFENSSYKPFMIERLENRRVLLYKVMATRI